MKMRSLLTILSVVPIGLLIAIGAWGVSPLPVTAPEAEEPEPVAEEIAAARMSLGVGAAPALAPLAAEVPRSWIPQGPGPAINGQVENIPGNNPVVGAVHAVAPHPSDASILYLGAVNGGVWRTTNATAASPNWVPLTDRFPSLSISSLEFDPTDGNNLTLVAGIGRFSNFGGRGGPLTGLLRTTDGGSTWTQLGAVDLAGRNISAVAPRGATILVAVSGGTNTGIYRSTDTGANFTRISNDGSSGLPAGTAFDLFGDPANTANLYAAIGGGVNGGVYFSNDTGANWVDVTDTTNIRTAGIVDGSEGNMELALSAAGTVYLAVCNLVAVPAPTRQRLVGVFQAAIPVTGGAGTWTPYGIPAPTIHPGGQCGSNLAVVADPLTANTVYVGGDRQTFPNGIGAATFSGNLSRGTAPNTWTPLTHNFTNSISAPHADSRDMAFDANGVIVEGDDGGIYTRSNPTSANGDWFSLMGDSQVTEFHDIAYDTNSDIIIGGAQDTGTPQQQTPGGATWDSVATADGGDVAVDNITRTGFSESIRYSSVQRLGSFIRETYDANNVQQGGTVNIGLTTDSGTVLMPGTGGNAQFKTPVELNAINPTRLIIGAQSTYESLNQGDNIDEIFGPGATAIQINRPGAVVYGGKTGGVPNEDVLYIGSGTQVFLRTTSAANLTATSALPIPGTVTDIVVDPDDWMTAYVTTTTRVFSTNNAGANWTNITGNLFGVANLRSIVFVPGSIPMIFVGGESGVFEMRTSLPGAWGEAGIDLPEAPVYDLEYVIERDILLAGTLGRGAWILSDVSIAPQIQVPADVSFGSVCIGSEGAATLNVCNTGNANLFVEEITSSDSQFAVTTPSGNYPVTISSDFCFPFQVVFTPVPAGATSATLTIPSNDPANPSITVDVTGNASEQGIVTIMDQNYGDVCLGNMKAQQLTLLNDGGCDLTINSVSIINDAGGEFGLATVMSTPFILKAGESVSADVEFTPTGNVGAASGQVSINHNATNTANPKLLNLSGNSPSAAISTFIANSGSFGEVCAGDLLDLALTVQNNGACPLEIDSAVVVLGANAQAGDFLHPDGSAAGVVVAPANSVQIPIRFSPSAFDNEPPAVRMATVDVDSHTQFASSTLATDVTAINGVVPPPDINLAIADSGDFGNVCKGDHADLDLTLFNQGKCDLEISNIQLLPDAGSFELPADLQLPLLLSPDADFTVPIRYSPTVCSDIPEVRTVRITSDDPDEIMVNVGVSGTSACPNLVIDPIALSNLFAFPATVVDDTGTLGCYSERSVNLRNTGLCPLTITSISATGVSGNPADFSVTDPTVLPKIVLPSGEETLGVTVRFTPQADANPLVPDQVTGLLTVLSDDPDGPHTANVCGESVTHTGIRILVTNVSTGSPVIVGNVDKLFIQGKGKQRPGPIKIKLKNVGVKSNVVCGNTINYHIDQETLPPVSTVGNNAKSSYKVRIQEGKLKSSQSFGLDQCEFRDFQVQLQSSKTVPPSACVLKPKGAPCASGSECCSLQCKKGSMTCK